MVRKKRRVLKQGNVHECVFARVTVRFLFFVRGGNGSGGGMLPRIF